MQTKFVHILFFLPWLCHNVTNIWRFRMAFRVVRRLLRGLRQHHHPQGPQRAPIAQDVGHRTAGIKLDRLSE